MARLANVYFDGGKWDPAVKTYRLIIEENGNDPEAPAYQANIVKAYEGQRMRDKVRVELKKLVDTYRPASEWAQANSRNKSALASAYDLTEGSMRELVTDYHQEAQKTKASPPTDWPATSTRSTWTTSRSPTAPTTCASTTRKSSTPCSSGSPRPSSTL